MLREGWADTGLQFSLAGLGLHLQEEDRAVCEAPGLLGTRGEARAQSQPVTIRAHQPVLCPGWTGGVGAAVPAQLLGHGYPAGSQGNSVMQGTGHAQLTENEVTWQHEPG